MSANDGCEDEAVVQSLFSTIQLELDQDDSLEGLISHQQLQRDPAFWIEFVVEVIAYQWPLMPLSQEPMTAR